MMASTTVFTFVGVFMSCVLVVGSYQCGVEGTQCMQKTMLNNGPVTCQTVQDVLRCLDKVISKCTVEYAKEGLIAMKASTEQQYNTFCSVRGCSQEDLSGCVPSNYRFGENTEVNLENCKIATCVEKIADRCPNLKPIMDTFIGKVKIYIKECGELIASGATTTRWSGLFLIVAVMIHVGFFYV